MLGHHELRESVLKKPVVIGLIVLGLLLAYVVAGPFMAVQGIRDAVKARDQEALAEHVDFPALRDNLKEQFNDKLMAEMAPSRADDPFAAFGLLIASKLVDAVVDALVTPSGLARVMSGEKVARLPRSEPGDEPDEDTEASGAQARKEPLANAAYRFSSPSRFVASIVGKDGRTVEFVLTRDGLSWRLTNILLPL